MKLIYISAGAILLSMAACDHADKKSPENVSSSDTIITQVKKDSNVAHGEYYVDTTYSEKETKIMDKISALTEVKKSNAYIDSFSQHTHGIALMIFKPEKGSKDYYVQAGYSGPERFETYYNFYVDSSTLAIRVDDAIEGDIVSLTEWRKREAKRK